MVSPAIPARAMLRPAHAANSLLAGQQGWGNQAMQRLMHSRMIKAKLTINEPGDQYEQEADRVADQVMRMPKPRTAEGAAVSAPVQPPRIQRVCSECDELHRQLIEEGLPVSEHTQGAHIQRMCPQCEDELHRQPMEKEKAIQAKATPGCTPETTPEMQAQVNAFRGAGQPLPESARTFFEPRFGHDFSQVRIHTDSQAAASTRAVNARAFTLGQEVVFGTGQYSPGTAAGQRLLAHELTHVVQQRASTPSLQLQPLTEEEKKENLKSPRFVGNPRLDDAFDNSPAMRKGEKGEAVKRLQEALIDDLCPSGTKNCKEAVMPISTKKGTQPPDGDFGDETFITVQKFQIKYDLLDINKRPDGRPGRKTLGKLDALFPGSSGGGGGGGGSGAPPSCFGKAVPTATPATCPNRNKAYCAAVPCATTPTTPTNPWLGCACTVSGEICRAIDAFTFTGIEGQALRECITITAPPPRSLAPTIAKGIYFRSTNACIWGHWRAALDALHDPTLPVPSALTKKWATAVTVCRSSGVGSKACCDAHIEAEQNAIDLCGPYPSSTFGKLPTTVPQAPFCSFIVAQFTPPPAFSGDFGKVADRIAYGKSRCCS